MIIGVNGGAGGGGGEVTEELPANTLNQIFDDLVAGTHTITAGAYHIRLYNDGLTNITANGATVYPGQTWEIESKENRATSRTDFCPAVTVVIPATGTANYQATYPSA